MKKKIIALAALGLTMSAAHADVGLSAELGTTGIGLHATVPVFDNLNARIGVNAFNYSYNSNTSNVDYDAKLKLQTFDVLADFYPISGSGFRLTGGLVYNGNKIEANGKRKNDNYTLNGNTYSASTVGSLNGNINFRKVAPYLGLGWGNAVAKDSNWSFTTDIGVMFQGSANTTLSNSNCTASAATCAQLSSDIKAEQGKLNDKVDDFKLYPVIRVGLSYKF